MAPNVATVLALCAGLTSVRLGIERHYELATIAVLVAAALDGLDGRLARLLRGTSRFGAELDSLTDFVNFGVAPILLLYGWTLSGLGGIGWIVALGFSICCALRMARFNTALDDPDVAVALENAAAQPVGRGPDDDDPIEEIERMGDDSLTP